MAFGIIIAASAAVAMAQSQPPASTPGTAATQGAADSAWVPPGTDGSVDHPLEPDRGQTGQ